MGEFILFHRCLLWSLTNFTNPSFGAVIEEFEVRDGLLALFAEKDGTPARSQFFAPHEVPVYG
jgi:hypothetical protein